MASSTLGVTIALLMYTAGIVSGQGDPILISKSFGRSDVAFLEFLQITVQQKDLRCSHDCA